MKASKTVEIDQKIAGLSEERKQIRALENKETVELNIAVQVDWHLFGKSDVQCYFTGPDIKVFREAPRLHDKVKIEDSVLGHGIYSYNHPNNNCWRRSWDKVEQNSVVTLEDQYNNTVLKVLKLESTKYKLTFDPYMFELDQAMFIAHKEIEFVKTA